MVAVHNGTLEFAQGLPTLIGESLLTHSNLIYGR